MDSSSSQEIKQDNEKDGRQLIVKLFQVLSKGGIIILAEHAELVSHQMRFPETNPDGSVEAQDKSSFSISWANHNKKMDLLHIAGDYVNSKGRLGQTPLHLSAETGDTELVDIFLKAGANVDAENICNQTPLHLSAYKGHKDVVETLLKAGANVEDESMKMSTPLHLSARYGHKELVETLLKAGANVDAEDKNKRTPLHLVALYGHKEVVETLLKAGANVDAEDNNKLTPLHISVVCEQDFVTELLLRAGASVKNKDDWGHTSFDYMNDRQRLRFGFKTRTLFKLRHWMYSLTNSKKQVQSSTSTKTKTEHMETISATFTDLNSGTFPCQDIRTIHNEESSNNNESQSVDDKDLQEMLNIRQQVENHWAKFFPETTEGCEMSWSHDVKAAFLAGRIVILTTINITQNKIIKNINKVKKVNHYYEPGASFNIHHVDNFAQHNQTVVHPIRKVTVDDDVDDSSSEEESDNEL